MTRVATSRAAVKFSENLLLNSNDLASVSWSRNAMTWAANQIANPIDGALTAGAIVDTAVNTSHFARQITPTTLSTRLNTIVTQSSWARAGAKTWHAHGANNGAMISYFDLTNGVVGNLSALASGMKDYGSGWWLCWSTYLLTAATPIFYVANANGVLTYVGAANNAIYVYAPMIHGGRSPGSPLITGATATAGPIRTARLPMNLAARSNNFASWTAINTSASDDGIADPLTGSLTASVISDTAADVAHGVGCPVAVPWATGTVMTQSIYAKLTTGSPVRYLSFSGPSGTTLAFFDLITGAVSGLSSEALTALARDVGGGWWRCSVTFTPATTTTSNPGVYLSPTDSGSPPTYLGTGVPIAYLTREQIVHGNHCGDLVATAGYPIGGASGSAAAPAVTGRGLRNTVNARAVP